MAEIRIGIIGYGKIAADQHAPAIRDNSDFRLVGAVTTKGDPSLDVPVFHSAEEMLAKVEMDAVAVTTPPGPRYAIARQCLEAGLHTLLEKPPAATLGEADALVRIAEKAKRALYATWHVQHHKALDVAAEQIRAEGLASMVIEWFEDVEKWHPGQQWIWAPGGFGVFDPGINALSVATKLSPEPIFVRSADLVLQEEGQQPIAANLELAIPGADGPVTAALDWRKKGADEHWTLEVKTKRGSTLRLEQGGEVLKRAGQADVTGGIDEYPDVYRRFAELVRAGQVECNVQPLRVVADALLVGKRSFEGAEPSGKQRVQGSTPSA